MFIKLLKGTIVARHFMKIIALYNVKGGVGKTASAVNLAHLAARDKRKTLLWDLDLQGSASYHFPIESGLKPGLKTLVHGDTRLKKIIKPSGIKNLDIIPADFKLHKLDRILDSLRKPSRQLEKLIKPVNKKYDFIFLDCPAGFSTLSKNILRAADVLLTPIIPSPLSMASFAQLMDHLRKKSSPDLLVLPFFSMVDKRKKIHREFLEKYENGHQGFLSASIPYSSAVEQMAAKQAPLSTFSPRSTAMKSYRALWDEVKLNIRMHDRIKKIKMW